MAEQKKSRATRKRRSDAEKASEALNLAERKLVRAQKRAERLAAEQDAAEQEVKALTAQRDYLAQHPALQSPNLFTEGVEG